MPATTLYDATQQTDDEAYPRPCVVMPGNNRTYAIGDIAYKVARPLLNGDTGPYPATLPRFAQLWPVMYVDGEWRNCMLGNRLIKDWQESCTLVEKL